MKDQRSELEKVKIRFEEVGLYLDEIEWDNMERLNYQSMPLEDWATNYIRRHRPNGLTLETAKYELKRKKKDNIRLQNELQIKNLQMYIAAFSGACIALSFQSISNIWEAPSIPNILLGYLSIFVLAFIAMIIVSGICTLAKLFWNEQSPSLSKLIITFLSIPILVFIVLFLLHIWGISE